MFVPIRFLLLHALLKLSNESTQTCPSFGSYYFKCFTHLTYYIRYKKLHVKYNLINTTIVSDADVRLATFKTSF